MNEKREPLRSPPQRAIAEAMTAELARSAADLWAGPNSTPEPIHAVQNFVYAIELPGGAAILRLTHESHRSRREVEAELRWLIDLGDRGLPVAKPLRSGRGAFTESVESKHGHFIVTCFERLPGVEPDPGNSATWNEPLFEQLGSMIAHLHQASCDAAWKPATLPRRTWRDESVVRNFHSLVPAAETPVHRAFDRVLAEIASLPRSPESFGLIHADLNHANFFIAPRGLEIFDFDDSCYCWFAYDLVVPIFHFPTGDRAAMEAAASKALRWLRRGYERVRPFDPVWLEWLSLFFKWRDLITYGFFYEQLEIAAVADCLRRTFLAMRARIEADRPIAEINDAG